ncbi:hypothetical protein [Enterovibrio norvegicus]|uniref:hypothetical protein n=1 Tax=Enterovibrio norvegicus TaxID=188144 RepID=UPI000C83F027|nr:hypothetical protein [Enterovibrio norvegicus]PMH64527.1 hypothetical protein BCU62_15850 [Enterovibrio norvegicus]
MFSQAKINQLVKALEDTHDKDLLELASMKLKETRDVDELIAFGKEAIGTDGYLFCYIRDMIVAGGIKSTETFLAAHFGDHDYI